jgi:hypothetical protein
MTVAWPENFYNYASNQFNNLELTKFIEGGGFSLIGKYKDNHKRRMGVGTDGPQVPFLKFIFEDSKNDDYLPLIVSIAITTRVVEGGATRFMQNDSRIKHLRPIDIVTNDDFYVSKIDGLVYEKKSNKYYKISLKIIYDRLYKLHVADIFTFKGAYIRSKRFIITKAPSVLFACTAWVLGWLLFVIKHDRYRYDVMFERFRDRRNDEPEFVAPASHESDIDFFGYKVQLWTLYTYSIIALISLFVFKRFFAKLTNGQESESVFNIALAIFSIITYDKIIPTALKFVIRHSSIYSYDLKYKNIKLKI